MNYFNQLTKIYLIAEIGVNHNGNIDLAKKMIEAARNSGADAVKFQTFRAKTLVTIKTAKVKYQESTTPEDESHYEMIKKLELSFEDHYELKSYCENLGLDFLSTPYDIESAKFLDELGVKLFKTASADLVDLPLHNFIANTGKPNIISVGMSSLGEIEDVLEIYRNAKNDNILLLHCVSNYPCSDESLNMNVMQNLESTFQIPIGYSDHSIGSVAAVISVALGARVIEKHFTTDKNSPGPDHKASSTPEEFKIIVNSVRRAEKMMGSRIKSCQSEEKQMRTISRKSITSSRYIKKGQKIELDDLIMMRPGDGLSAKFIPLILGKKATREILKNIQFSLSDFQ